MPIALEGINKAWARYDYGKGLYRVISDDAIDRFPARLMRKDLRRKKELAKIRGEYVYFLEIYFEGEMHRIAEYMPEHLAAFLHDELNHGDPGRGTYAGTIEEYAAIQEVDAGTAYRELRLKLQSSGIARMRNYALHNKFMMEVNRCETTEELEAVRARVFEATVHSAKI